MRRLRLVVTTVKGPCGELKVCLVYRRIKDLSKVVLPTYEESGYGQMKALEIQNGQGYLHQRVRRLQPPLEEPPQAYDRPEEHVISSP